MRLVLLNKVFKFELILKYPLNGYISNPFYDCSKYHTLYHAIMHCFSEVICVSPSFNLQKERGGKNYVFDKILSNIFNTTVLYKINRSTIYGCIFSLAQYVKAARAYLLIENMCCGLHVLVSQTRVFGDPIPVEVLEMFSSFLKRKN